MSNITVSNKPTQVIANANAIICRTPKTLNDTTENNITSDNRCVLVTSTDQLIEYFGDPFIDPCAYTELIIAYKLVAAGFPIYISSIYEMYNNSDGFKFKYNGYTEFYFRDKNKHKTVGYKLKSNIKFCQPIIQFDYNKDVGQLDLYVSLYLMKRDRMKSASDINRVDPKRLYNTYHLLLNTENLTDSIIIDALDKIGLELKVLNNSSDTSLVDEFKRFTTFRVMLDFNDSSLYEFDFHSNDYNYCFSSDDTIFNAYYDAIDRLKNKVVQPNFICLSKLYRSVETWVEDNIIGYYLSRAYLIDLDSYSYSIIYNYLMSKFDEDSDTYLFINAPDVSVSTAIDFFSARNDYENMITILSHYNCDAFYGYAGDYIQDSLYYPQTSRVYYSASILTFYNLIYNQINYSANAIGNMNISCDCIKSIITEESALTLLDYKCNSIVIFDKGFPSIYGDSSLSSSPNLQYSHISRTFVYIRHLIREYVETLKFTLSTLFNIELSVNYIKRYILDVFTEQNILRAYTVDYNVENKTVEFNINLWFNGVIESINLNFII